MDENTHYDLQDTMDNKFLPFTSLTSGLGLVVMPDLYCYTNQIVNVCFAGDPDRSMDWVLVDTGMPESADRILAAAKERFGENNKPKAIVLTHGHFDHVGCRPR
jgi:glyoxylase-like metal-dependent hydrolase (beta-lactamase superfamily II)